MVAEALHERRNVRRRELYFAVCRMVSLSNRHDLDYVRYLNVSRSLRNGLDRKGDSLLAITLFLLPGFIISGIRRIPAVLRPASCLSPALATANRCCRGQRAIETSH